MSTSHLASLRNKKRRERLEWLGDAVMEEAIVRLVAREALAALERQEVGIRGSYFPATLRPISHRLREVLRLAVSNTNLSAVYSAELVGLVAFLGLGHDEHDHLGGPGRRLCRSDTFGPPAAFLSSSSSSSSTKNSKDKVRDKQRPDLVESAIGEAFEASLGLGGGAGGGRLMQSTSGPQRFAGRHRATLVDRLLSSALSTEIILSFLEPQGGWTGVDMHDPGSGSGTFTNSFGALDTDEEEGREEAGGDDGDDDDDDDDDDAHEVKDSRSPSGIFGSIETLQGQPEGGIVGEMRRQGPVTGGVSVNPQTSARCPCPSTCGAQAQRECGEEQVSRLADRANDAENIAAGREGVLRLYGAALLKFRVTVFLFCSANAAATAAAPAAGDDEEEEGPRELTMRRQRVMCAENLAAVAEHLQSLVRDNEQTIIAGVETGKTTGLAGGSMAHHVETDTVAKGSPPSAAAGACPMLLSPPNWLRVAVGRAALEVGGDHSPAFSARVAALLLSRSGERGGPPPSGGRSSGGGGGDCRVVREYSEASGIGEEEVGGEGAGARRAEGGVEKQDGRGSTAARAAMAAMAAETCFRRDSWPDTDLPRASDKAAQLFSPCKIKADAGAKNVVGASCNGRASFASRSDDYLIQAGDGDGSDDQQPLSPPRRGRKRKRAQQNHGSSSSVDDGGEFRLPPHYAGLVGRLPRESRQLLSRLGHHGYVKVLEELLGQFLRADPADSRSRSAADSLEAKPSDARVATLDRAIAGAFPIDVLLAGLAPPEEKAEVVSGTATDKQKYNQLSARRQEDAALDAPDPWRTLQVGRAHPSLCGLVEPPELARAEPERMVLPMPNPFYRRVLHALCLVHGLRSRGGETVGGGGGLGCDGAAVRHRTVEVTRIRSVGSNSDDEKRRLRSKGAGRAAAVVQGGLIPVETLLGTE